MKKELIDCNGMSNCLMWFYAKKLGNRVHIYNFCAIVSLELFFFFANGPVEYKLYLKGSI